MSGVDGVPLATCDFREEKYDTLFGEVVSAAADARVLSKAAGSLMMINSIHYIT